MSIVVELLSRGRAVANRKDWFERIAKLALVQLLTFNAVLLLYPRQLPGVELVDRTMFMVSSYVSPLLMASVLIFGWLSNPQIILKRSSMVTIALCTSVYMLSALLNGPTIKSVAVATYFGLAAYGVQYAWMRWPSMAEKFVTVTTAALTAWLFLAIGLLLTPVAHLLVNIDYGYSFHGFADSRIMYGAWGSIALVLIGTAKDISWKAKLVLLSCCLLGLFISRSRSALLGTLLVVIYATVTRQGFSFKTMALSVVFSLITLVGIYLWAYMGRTDALEFYNSDRWYIFNTYMAYIKEHGSFMEVLFGQAQQISIPGPSGGVTQAHNLLLQWYVNWGALGLLALLGFLTVYWTELKTPASKMILIVLVVFSLMLPIQGTENFFSPVTLMVFFIASALGNRVNNEEM